MKDRTARHEAIKRQIQEHRVSSQEDLLSFLHNQGFDVTQATLSRDMKMLQVRKTYDGFSGYFYTMPDEGHIKEPHKNYTQDLLRGWISIQFSGNLGVVRTLPGHADSVAIALDNMALDGLLGTVAGDDTIILVLEEGIDRSKFTADLKQKAPAVGDEL